MFGNYQFGIAGLTFYQDPIVDIDSQAFSTPNVMNYLTYLSISHSNLTSFPQAIQSLPQLTTFYLMYSLIKHLPPDSFNTGTFGNLRTLRIYYNAQLTTMASYAFRGLTNLTTLDLSSNAISLIPQKAFAGLNSISSITLYGNNILVIQSGAFQSIPLKSLTVAFGKSSTLLLEIFKISNCYSMSSERCN